MATLTRRATLPVVRETTCPAALPIAGTTTADCGVVCRAMQQDREREQGLGLTPKQVAMVRDGSDGVLLTAKSDPSTIEQFCTGRGVPVLDNREKAGGRDSYTYCPVWQAERERILDGRKTFAGGGVAHPDPKTVAHFDDGRGNTLPPEYVDPWAQAQHDLDLLAD